MPSKSDGASKITFVHNHPAGFVVGDLAILRERYTCALAEGKHKALPLRKWLIPTPLFLS